MHIEHNHPVTIFYSGKLSPVIKTIDTIFSVASNQIQFLQNPSIQMCGGLLALGYGVCKIASGECASTIGLSIGGIILYTIDRR